MQAEILLQSAKARDPLAKPAKPAAQHVYASFPAGPTDAAAGTRPAVCMPCIQDVPRDWSSALRGFVVGNAWTCVQHPCPWLLIMLMFERATGNSVTPSKSVHEQHALNATSVGSLLSDFRAEFRKLVRNVINPEDRSRFGHVCSGQHCLKQLGFTGYVSQCVSWPILSSEVQHGAFEDLLRLRPKLPRGWQAALAQGSLALRPTQLCLKLLPKWRAHDGSPLEGQRGGPAPFLLACPASCGATLSLVGKPCRVGSSSWPKVRCHACGVEARCATAICRLCSSPLRACECRLVDGRYVPRGRQTLLRPFI